MKLTKLLRALVEIGKCSLMPAGAARMHRRSKPRPTLDLDFTQGQMPPGLNFSRSSNATRVGPTGLLEWAPHNLTPNSTMVGGVAGIIGSGATVPTSWNISAVAGITIAIAFGQEVGGMPYMDITYSGTNTSGASAFPTVFLGAGAGLIAASNTQPLTGSAYIKKVAGTDTLSGWSMAIRGRNSGTLVGGQATSAAISGTPTDLTRYSRSFTFTATVTHAELVMQTTVAAGAAIDITVRVAGPQVENGLTATTLNPTSGSAYYGPRFDYDPVTLACQGLLIEEQRTNLAKSSGLIVADTGTTVAQNATNFFGIANSAYTLTESKTAGIHFSYAGNAASFTSGTTYSVTVYISASTAARIQLTQSSSVASTAPYANFSLSGVGSVLSVGASTSAYIRRVTSMVYACTIVFAATATISASPVVVAFINSDTATRLPAYAGGLLAVIFHGMQCEASPIPTSYMPTFGAAATRASDACFYGSQVGIFGSPRGTLFVEWVDLVEPNTISMIVQMSVGIATTDRASIFSYSSTPGQIRGGVEFLLGGVTQYYQDNLNPTSIDSVQKMAYSFSTMNFGSSKNGAINTLTSTGSTLSGFDRINIGSNAYQNQQKTKRIRRISYYPTTLPSNVLQALAR